MLDSLIVWQVRRTLFTIDSEIEKVSIDIRVNESTLDFMKYLPNIEHPFHIHVMHLIHYWMY